MEIRHMRFSRKTPVPIGCIHLFPTSSTCRIVIPLSSPQKRISRFVLGRGWFIDHIFVYLYGITCAFSCFLVQKFVEKFSRELNTEYGGKGKNGSNIVVQCVLPGYVATNMSKITKTSWMVPSPDKFVRSALQTTGLESVTTGYLPHTLMVSVLLPRSPSDNAFFYCFSVFFASDFHYAWKR